MVGSDVQYQVIYVTVPLALHKNVKWINLHLSRDFFFYLFVGNLSNDKQVSLIYIKIVKILK